MPTELKTLRSRPVHRGHSDNASSVNDCTASKPCPHSVHAYWYVGNGCPSRSGTPACRVLMMRHAPAVRNTVPARVGLRSGLIGCHGVDTGAPVRTALTTA